VWRWLRVLAIVAGVLVLMLVAGLVAVYWAVRQVPDFYEQSLQADPAKEAVASDEMLQQTTALVSEVKQKGQWQAVFTTAQINGWLAVDLEKNHPGMIPSGVSDPRVSIAPEELAVACRYEGAGVATVLWLSLDVYLDEPNVVAVRIKKARAGMLPMPLDKVLEAVTRGAQRLEVDLQWRQSDGDPVALITIPPERLERDKRIHVESVRLGDSEVFLAGTTEPADPKHRERSK